MSSPLDIATIGEDLPLFEAIRTTRSIRRLLPDPVPLALVRKVCEAGTFAPSGGNRQPWYFIAVTDAQRRAFIAERYRAAFAGYIAPALQAAEAPDYPEGQRKVLPAVAGRCANLAQQLRSRGTKPRASLRNARLSNAAAADRRATAHGVVVRRGRALWLRA